MTTGICMAGERTLETMPIITAATTARTETARANEPVEPFGPFGEFSLELATTPEQRLICWRMVHEEYRAKGYTQDNGTELRFSEHDALPGTGTFLVKKGKTPIGTISVFPDSPLGLPADAIYRKEIAALRAQGRKVAEIGRLTVAAPFAGDRKVLMEMIEIPCMYARSVLKATDVVITVNPAHRSFYERMMLFDTLGQEKPFDSVCGAMAVLLRMDLARQRDLIRQAHGETEAEERRMRRTVYRVFRSEADEARFAARVRKLRRPLPPDFLRRHFHSRPADALNLSDKSDLSDKPATLHAN